MYLLTSSFVMLTVAIKKRSRIPGVVITQYVEEIPPGKSTPDFTRKLMPINIQEGMQTTFSEHIVQKCLLHNNLIDIKVLKLLVMFVLCHRIHLFMFTLFREYIFRFVACAIMLL